MVNRVGGLASGMDIDALVEKLMTAEKTPLVKVQQQKQKYEWERDAYRDINKQLKTFDSYLFDNFKLASNFNKKIATSSNPSLVGVTASSSASGSLTIDSVTKLAKAARGVSDTKINATGDTKLSELFNGQDVPASIKINGIQKDGSMMKEASEIKIDENETVDSLIKKINNSGAGVTAFFENGKMSITSKNMGKNATGDGEIIVESGAEVFNKLGFSKAKDGGALANDGENAILSINGIETERSSNDFSINGYKITLQSTFSSATPVNLTASTDTDHMVSKIKEFVDTYNGLVESINTSLNESKYRDYQPLTDEQKEEMSEEEIKKWEQKAKSGLLRRDSILSEGISGMRASFMGAVGGLADRQYNSLAKSGITTTKTYSDGGKLEINEEKLRAAIENNPEQISQMFSNSGTQDTVNGQSSDSRGIVDRLRNEISKMELKIEKKAGRATSTESTYTLGKSIIDSNKRIERLQDKLETVEARYWKQFTAMETAINKANSQSSIFSQYQ